ncbi:MAG TPA: VWA domain-containing protein [Vicinamibacterales bacterium]|nr:VWA domain-containing protein [Vicinamibacterales bacterium]
MRVPVGLAFLFVATLAVLSAQDTQQDPPVFKAESDLVVLHVNVFDGKSDAVPNLPETAFQIVEDNAPQKITFFSNEDVPVTAGLIVDNSGSMITRRAMVMTGTKVFAESSHPEDELFTIVFNEHVRHGLPASLPFTRNRVQIQTAVSRFPPGGKTALHDAVIDGLEHLQEASHQKRVLVVLSDGEDNASVHSDDVMVERAVRSDALIYTVSTARLGADVGRPGLLRRLARTSGGVAYAPKDERAVIDAFQEIAGNIRRGYSIGYVPTNTSRDGRFRRVKVSVRAPGQKNLTVIARDGYLAPNHAATD